MGASHGLEVAAQHIAAGDLDRAESVLRATVDRTPREGRTWFMLGEVLAQRGENSQARAAFDHAARCATGSDDEDAQTIALAARARAATLGSGPRRGGSAGG